MFKRDDWMFGLLAVAVGAVTLYGAAEVAGIRTMDPAGPAALPRIVAYLMIAIGLMHIIGSLLVMRGAEPTAEKKKKNNLPVVIIIAVSLVYYVLLEEVGYPVLTPLLILAVMASVGERNVRKIGCTAIGVSLILFVIFYYGLGVHMPLGVLHPLFN